MEIEFSAGTQENQNGWTEACEPSASGARGLDRKAVRYELRGLAMCEVECRAFVI